jgi:cysteine desulfurase
MEHENTHVKALRDHLQEGILAAVPNCFVTGDPDNRLPNTLNIAFEYIEGEAILMLLNKEGIAASSGSACTSGSLEPSHVMRAMEIPYTAAHGTIRFSLSRHTSDCDVEKVIKAMPGIAHRLRQLSPYWDGDKPKANPEAAFAPTYA